MKNDEQIKVFCQNIKILREKSGLSKKEMAEILEIGTASLTKLEQGIMPPRMRVNIVYQLSQNFNIQPCKLFMPL